MNHEATSYKRMAGVLALATMTLVSLPSTALAQTQLRVADSLPAGHFFAERGMKFWVDEVRKQTNNAISLQHFPAEQLGKAKDMLQLAMSGVSDMSYVVPSYVSDKMPLMTVSELPGLAESSCQGTEAFLKLAHGGVLAQRELDPNGIVILISTILEPYQVYANKPIGSLNDVSGLKLRTAGGAQAATVRALGGVPVNMAAPDTYDSLTRGTIDGVVFPTTSLLAYDLPGRLKAGTQDVSFGTVLLTYAMSKKRFQAFPKNVQEAMLEAGKKASRNVCEFLDASGASNRTKIEAAGVKHFKLSAADQKKLADASASARNEWATQLERRGLPGNAVLEAYQNELR
jgi:TRAP-type C4-dicarboxylate transport system substrate-binding protein